MVVDRDSESGGLSAAAHWQLPGAGKLITGPGYGGETGPGIGDGTG